MVEHSGERSARVKLKRPIELYQWAGPFEGWSRNWVHKNFWRVRQYLGSEEDAMAECALIFTRCVRMYGHKINNPAHLMALFKQAVFNDWNTYAKRDGHIRACPPPDEDHRVDYNPGPLFAAINEASSEAKQVLMALANAPAEFLSLLLGAESDVMLNCRLIRLLKLKPGTNVVGEIKQLLS